MRKSTKATEVFSEEQKIKIVAELEGRTGTASALAEHYGIGRTTAYVWRRELMEDDNHEQNTPESERLMVSKAYESLPEEIEALKLMADDLRIEVRRLQIERDVHEAALDILKKKTNLENLSNRDKAKLVTSLRSKWKLKDLLEIVRMAKSSYEYAVRSLETQVEEENGIKEMIIAAYERAAAPMVIAESYTKSVRTVFMGLANGLFED